MATGLLKLETTTLLICGFYNLGFAAFHAAFWSLFGWPAKLRPSGTINAAITQTLNVVLTYCFLLYGGALAWTALGYIDPHPFILISGAGFWLLRTVLQPVLFSMRDRRSVGITIIFLAGFAIHAAGVVFAVS
ncbi:hypothetical protein T8J41_04670 [Nitratireductor rhodophyticola]|uniref:hypothetical protein n=1 Tax=Nitratireductor rhodophyticola TaxID=2854036 RepID=UPI002AC897D3|nr:hypothetical protein [Nitratireductor rhodophyticola]MEC9244243.1 hypothetical protein [Pseudomonadota bacterium]WPZ15117.1 hypothetical protein T8J41_04670 [Nitratireductor rhodophyticola]